MRVVRFLKWAGIALLVLVALLVVVSLLITWNQLRGPIAAWLSEQLEREVRIEGDLNVNLLTPRVSAENVWVANTAWGHAPQLARIGRVELRYSWPQLLRGQWGLTDLRLDDTQLALEQSTQGQGNWEFAGEGGGYAAIDRLALQATRISYRLHGTDTEVSGVIETGQGALPRDAPARIELDGRLQGLPFALSARGDALQVWAQGEQPYRFAGEGALGDARFSAQGQRAGPPAEDLMLDLEIDGQDLATLSAVLPVQLPHSLPYRLRGRLLAEGRHWAWDPIQAQLGDSRGSGALRLALLEERPALYGSLHFSNLDTRQLGEMLTFDRDDAGPERDMGAIALEVAVTAREMPVPGLQVQDLATQLSMADGRLRAAPFVASLAEGSLAGRLELDMAREVPSLEADLQLRAMQFEALLRLLGVEGAGAGRIDGELEVAGQGDSPQAMLQTLRGMAVLVLTGGALHDLPAEGIGLHLPEVLDLLGWEDETITTEVPCAVAALDLEDGKARANPVIADMPDALLVVEGSIDLAERTVDVTLDAPRKDPGLAIQAPLRVHGSLAEPQTDRELGEAVGQGLAAAALGALLAPIAGLAPLLDPGTEEDNPCETLLGSAREAHGQR